jgi:hypothetical protein
MTTGRCSFSRSIHGQRPDYAFNYAGNRSEEIRDMLYVNLFQILVQNPQMTATEALIRQEEKGLIAWPSWFDHSTRVCGEPGSRT